MKRSIRAKLYLMFSLLGIIILLMILNYSMHRDVERWEHKYATINEINCFRKHLSMIKGGKLAQMIYPANSLNFILSDVVGDRLDCIASGPTWFDESTFLQMSDIADKYQIRNQRI